MRIITGIYRGRTLKTVPDLSVRPATGRVRQTLFNMLVNRIEFDGLHVLDLYAGSGSLGFEALSRGARHVTFVEREGAAADLLDQNARSFGCLESVEIVEGDAGVYLDTARQQFGLIFADPPYALPGTGDLPGRIFAGGFLLRGGYLLIEHASSIRFADGTGFEAAPTKKFGRTMVTFFHHLEDSR